MPHGHDQPHDHVKDQNEPRDQQQFHESPALVKELHDDLDSGNGHKLWKDLKGHDLEVAQTTVDGKFGACLIIRDKDHKDKNGHDLLFEVKGDKALEAKNGVTIDKNGNIHFKDDGFTIDSNGTITDGSGKIVSDPTGTGTTTSQVEATSSAAQTQVNDVSQQINTVEANAASGNVSTAMIDSTKSNINEMIRKFSALGLSAPAGLTDLVSTLDRAHSQVAESDAKAGKQNGYQSGDARIGVAST